MIALPPDEVNSENNSNSVARKEILHPIQIGSIMKKRKFHFNVTLSDSDCYSKLSYILSKHCSSLVDSIKQLEQDWRNRVVSSPLLLGTTPDSRIFAELNQKEVDGHQVRKQKQCLRV